MLIYVKALPAVLFCRRVRQLSTLTQIYNAAARLCLFWRGPSRSSNPHQVNHHPSAWRGSELLTLCVCVCLLNVWLAGSGVGVVRTLEATSWRTTPDPTHLSRCTLTPSLRSDGDSCFSLKRSNRAAGWSSTAVGLCQTRPWLVLSFSTRKDNVQTLNPPTPRTGRLT